MVRVIECKDLDIVRRDWSLLAKELAHFCLTQILSGGYVTYLFDQFDYFRCRIIHFSSNC